MQSHALLQGIFLTQGLNLCLLCLPHWQVGSLPQAPCRKPAYSHQGILFSHLKKEEGTSVTQGNMDGI